MLPSVSKLRLVLTGLLLVTLSSCYAPPFDASAVVTEWKSYMLRDYKVQPGDTLAVKVFPEGFAEEVRVPPTGAVVLPRLDKAYDVVDKTLPMIRRELIAAYKKVFRGEFSLYVNLSEVGASTVYVTGEVRNGGAVPYPDGMMLTQAISHVGGLVITAQPKDIRILRMPPGQPPRTFRVHLLDILEENQPDFMLLPGDVVYVPTSGIAEAGNWVQLYIRRMLPFNFPAAPL